jgi:DNA polymerase III epsilon subunit-like protein
MTEVQTLVYFDLEATGLKSSGRPRISELSLVAVNIQDVLQMHKAIMENIQNRTVESSLLQTRKLSPRIVNKLTLCVYPMATIVPLVSDITGLDNYNLMGQSKFSKSTGDLLNSFLSLLPAPLCLVAHNGNDYDFPLLKAELDKTGTQLKSDILCIDSYVGIREIFKKEKDIVNLGNKTVTEVKLTKENNIVKMELDAVSDLISKGEFEIDMEEGTHTEINFSKSENEETPKSTKYKSNICLPPKKRKQFSGFEIVKSRKALKFEIPGEPVSFSLINLHRHLLGCSPEQSHGAEADCLSLMRTTAALGDKWIDWVKENCLKFETCKKMWG